MSDAALPATDRGPGRFGEPGSSLRRRSFLTGVAGVSAAAVAAKLAFDAQESFLRADVFTARASSYDIDLASIVRNGLLELGLGPERFRGKSVLLKPNLVEPSIEAPWINTHPSLVAATVEVFRGFGARDVFIAEGPGHCRDFGLTLDVSGIAEAARTLKVETVDLNHDDVITAVNRTRMTRLPELHLPATLRRADWIVSMPKLKTHHWVGVTAAMKNLFGMLPGVCYGWPKNVLHHMGINESIIDVNAAIKPHLAIVDAVVGMEGDGPLMGEAKPLGAIVIGTSLAAVDATAMRLMGVDPAKVAYMAWASGKLGPIAEAHIRQRGEPIRALASPFALMKQWRQIAGAPSARSAGGAAHPFAEPARIA